MKVWAGIVTYNPDLERLKENIDSIYNQISKLVIFDNGSNNYDEIFELSNTYAHIKLIKSDANKGLAYGLNVICADAYYKNADWILLLDQDSVSDEKCILEYSKYIDLDDAAILSPIMFDSRRRVRKPVSTNGYKEIKECIQSGALYNIRSLKDVGFFDEWYFIDYIDYDYCISVRRKGYKIYQINSLLLDQEASAIKPVFCHDFLMGVAKKLNSDFIAKLSYRPIIKPWRSYYTARNRVYYIYKNRDMLNVPLEKVKSALINIRNVIRIPDHIGTATAIYKGILDGKKKVREIELQ